MHLQGCRQTGEQMGKGGAVVITKEEMQRIRNVIHLNIPNLLEANYLIREIELAVGMGQAASRPGYKGALND